MSTFNLSDYVTTVNGEDVINADGMALLLGLSADVVRDEMKRQMNGAKFGAVRFPDEWMRQGRRVTKRVAAITGSYDALVHLRFLHDERSAKGGA